MAKLERRGHRAAGERRNQADRREGRTKREGGGTTPTFKTMAGTLADSALEGITAVAHLMVKRKTPEAART
jgi:hypothetical protein